MDEIEAEKMKNEKVNETKSWFFEKIKKIDKPLVQTHQEKNERAHIIKKWKRSYSCHYRNPRIIGDYYEQNGGTRRSG